MSDYQLAFDPNVVFRVNDEVWIPNAPGNKDWDEYQIWVEAGNEPDPYVPPKPEVNLLSTEDVVFYNHENRIRAMEGKEPITVKDIVEIKKQIRDSHG